MYTVQLLGLLEMCVNEAHNTGNVGESLSDTFPFQNGLKHEGACDHCV
jgi:hypothetical protein